MKEFATLAALVSFAFACGAAPTTHTGEETSEDTAAVSSSLGIPDGVYPVRICGLHYEHGKTVEVRSADGMLYVISPDSTFYGGPKPVIPVGGDGSFSVVDYRAATGGQVHTISGRVSFAGGVLYLHYGSHWDFYDTTRAGMGAFVQTSIEGDGDGTYDTASGASPGTCVVVVKTVDLTGVRTSSIAPHESTVSVTVTVRMWGDRRTISGAGFEDVTIDPDGHFSIERSNPNGGSSYFRGTVKAGVIDAVAGTSSTFVTFDEHLTGFYNP